MGILYVTAVFVFCYIIITNGVNAEYSCHKGCPQPDNGILKYIPGNVYEYNFDSIMTVSLKSGIAATETDDTSLKVMGTAKIFAEGNCGYVMQLGAVKVATTKETVEKKIIHSIQKPVHFKMVNGKLEPQICTDDSDNVYALNIKRGIISLFQSYTTEEDSVEVDVFGQCPTHTSISKAGKTQVVTKVRNLNNCAYRKKIKSGLINGVVNAKSGIRSAMLLQADYVKEAELSNGVISKVDLAEEYKFVGAPGGGGNVRAKVVTSMKLKHQGAPGTAPATGSHGVSLIFQKPEVYVAKNIAALKNTVTDMVDATGDYVRKDSAKKFVELIRLMRNADADTLLELSTAPHPNKVLARKVYLDALFRTNTAESGKAIVKLLTKMDDKEKLIGTLSLNAVQYVDKDLLSLATTLLTPNAAKETFMAVGNIVSKYCQDSDGCSQADIEPISKRFTDSLKHCKSNSKKTEERIIYILKGIGNTQHLAASVAATLTECAAPGHPMRIRVAALQAFSAASCEAVLQNKALGLLADHNEDSELRIESYLAAITCPNVEVANKISEIVNSETVYQVGGFIASHLKAIRDSTDATREHQRYYLGNIRVTKHFPKDFRRYSFNNELSYKLDAIGVSASSDYKLIYSQHGFLPRSARLNVTTEIFGTNFNIFEASVRQDNIENILEYYIGPKGLLNKDFDEIMKIIEVGSGPGVGGRARRSITDDTANFAKKYKTYGSKNMQDVNLDVSLKLFGSEMFFLSLGDNIPSSLQELIQTFSVLFDNTKKQLSSFNKEFVIHNLFMDIEYMYPTGLGIPLELSSQGFAVNKLDVGVNIDVDAMLEQNWLRGKYRVKVVPSTDVSVNVQIGFNAYVLASGIRVGFEMHSANGADVNFAFINDGNGFNVDIELPREKIELVDLQVTPNFYIAELNKETKSIALKGNKKHNIDNNEWCFTQLEGAGFTLCVNTNVELPKTHSEDTNKIVTDDSNLIRPVYFSLHVTSERKINLKGYHESKTNNGEDVWKLDFSTPGSKVSHDTSLALELGFKERIFGRLSFVNPQVQMALQAGITNDNKELVLYAQMENSNDIKKSKIGFLKNGNEYSPVIEIQDKDGVTNNINGYYADGKVVVQKSGESQARYDFNNFQVTNKDVRAIINGWVDMGKSGLSSELHVALGQQSYLIKNDFKLEDEEIIVGFFINNEKTPDNVTGVKAKLKFAENELYSKIVGKLATWELDMTNELQFEKPENNNVVPWSKFNNMVALKKGNELIGSINLSGLTETDKKLEVVVEAKRGKKLATLSIKFNTNQRTEDDYLVEINAKVNKHFAEVILKCDAIGNHYVVDHAITTSWGTTLTVKGELGQRYTSKDILIDLQGIAQFNGKDKPTQWILKIIGTPEKTNSELKLSRDNVEILKYSGETQHPQDKVISGKLNLILKNVLHAKGDFKIAKNGKGELSALVETQKADDKHKLDINSKFLVQPMKLDVEVKLNFDGSKELTFKTENSLDKQKFSTKNIAEGTGLKKISFDANGVLKGEWRTNFELLGDYKLITPDERVVDGTFKTQRNYNVKSGIGQANFELELNDQEPNGGKKRTFIGKRKVDKFNIKTKEFTEATNLVYKNLEGQTIEWKYSVNSIIKGAESRLLDVSTAISGDLVKLPSEVTFVLDDYSRKRANLRFSLKTGQVMNMLFSGNFGLGERGVPSTYDIQGKLEVPESTFKTFEISSNGKYLKPETEDGKNHILELHIDEKIGSNKFTKFNAVLNGFSQQRTYSVDFQSDKMNGPLKLEGSYKEDRQGTFKDGNLSDKQHSTFNLNYADKYIKSTSDINYASESANIHFIIESSYESAKYIDIKINAQQLEVDNFAVELEAKQNQGEVYKVESKIYRSSHKKGLDVHATMPNGEPVVFVCLLEMLGDRKAKFILDVQNIMELDLMQSIEASYKDVYDFYILGQVNSAKLKLDNYDLNVRSQGKAISMNLKNAKGVIFSGTATYSLKKEKNKTNIEGQGQLQFNGKTQNTNFRLLHQKYDFAVDKEFGFSYTLNGNFGPKNGVFTLKLTNKEYNVKVSVCEEKKQCTNVQVQATVIVDEQELSSVQHSFLILFDLRELGYPYEFAFRSNAKRQGFKFEYSLDSNIVSSNNMKYQLMANVLPKGSKVQLKLPNREILIETQQQHPPYGQMFGHYENSFVFYFDKQNKPNDVTRVVSSADITGADYMTINAHGVLKFEHPSIRPFTISGKFDANRSQRLANAEFVFDIFRVPEQRIIATSRIQNVEMSQGFNISINHLIQSSGLGLQYEFNGHTAVNPERQEISAGTDIFCSKSNSKSSIYLYANIERLEATVYGMNEEIVHLVGELNRQKHLAKFETKLKIFGQKPIEFVTELHPSTAKFFVNREGLIDATGEVNLGKEIKFHIENAGKHLLNGRVALDANNFLQTTYQSNEADINTFLTHVETEVKHDTELAREHIQSKFQKLRQNIERQIQLAKDSAPDFTPLKQSYEANINEIVKTLENDTSLKQLADSYHKLYSKLAKIAIDITDILRETSENLHKSLMALYAKLEILLKDTIMALWEEVLLTLTKVVGELRIEIVKLYTKTIKSILNVLKEYGPILKSYGKAVYTIFQPFTEVWKELQKVFIEGLQEVVDIVKEWLAKAPSIEALSREFKSKLQEFKLVEKTLHFLNNIFDQLHILPLTTEVTELLEKTHQYLEIKLKQQNVNDEQLLQELYTLFITAVRSVLSSLYVSSTSSAGSVSNSISTWLTSLPYSVDVLNKLPGLFSFRSSVFNYLINEKWENVFNKDHFKSWIFFNEFQLKGHIVNGHHFVTFDGQYVHFPSSCKYILAQDSVDNNFTVVAQLNNGKLKSIILTDRDGNFMEINDLGQLKSNGNPAEYPQHNEGGMHAWRLYYTSWLLSEYGVQVMCTTDLKVCHITINGFYTSKTRGLLGNGNAEPNDDFIKVDGTLAENSATFGNGYGLGKCEPVATTEKQKQHTELCNEIFGLESPLVLWSLVLNADPFREACDTAVTLATEKDKETAACTVALAYGSALKMDRKLVMLPSRCLKCIGAIGQRDLAQEFTVKIPNNKADVVFVVDVDVKPAVLSNLVAPAIKEIRETLKARGFTDIQVGVIAYNESQSYPALLTSDNGKLNYNGNLAEVKLDGPKQFGLNSVQHAVADPKVLEFYKAVEELLNSVVIQSDEKAFRMALNYPFRSGAAKTIIGVRSDSLEFSNLFKITRAHAISTATYLDAAVLHLIGPVKEISLEGIPTEKLVGFNARLVATLDGKDAKKRPKLQFHNDLGIELVLNSGGWVFATENFDSLKPQDQKKVLSQVTNSIADTMFKTELVSDCKCLPVHGLHAQHKCTVKSSTFVPNKKPKAAA